MPQAESVMHRVGKWTLLLSLAILPAIGCAAKRPYAHDPVLRGRNPVWGQRGSGTVIAVPDEPLPPRPPSPVELPTLEWEATRTG